MASPTPQKCEEPATPAGMRLVLCEIHDAVHTQLDDYGLTALVGADAYFSTPADVPPAWEGRASVTSRPGSPGGAD